LITIAEGDSYRGVGHAIELLAQTGSPRAGEVLTRLLDRDKEHQRQLIRALTRLEHKGAALRAAMLLAKLSLEDDMLLARYLSKVAVPAVTEHVLKALEVINKGRQIMAYVRILEASAPGNAAAARKLLPLLDNQKLDRTELKQLAKALAVIAPAGHEPTIERLKAVIEAGLLGPYALQVAITLDALGDKKGPQILKKNLILATRRSREYTNHNFLGDYSMAFGDYKAAVSSYKSAIKHTTGSALDSMLQLHIARAQAKREKWTLVRDALKESKWPKELLLREFERFPELKEALKHDAVKKYMDSLDKK
jgi:predicted negative regulator of RcsB-dependent stress response